MLRRVALAITDVSEEHSAPLIKVTSIREPGKTLAVAVPRSPILVTLMMGRYVPTKRWFLHEPHGITFQKTAFFTVTAVKTSSLTKLTIFNVFGQCTK
jgi:hypothetical protein